MKSSTPKRNATAAASAAANAAPAPHAAAKAPPAKVPPAPQKGESDRGSADAAPAVSPRRAMTLSPTSPSYKTYMQKGIGLNYGQHPALIDDCLDRAIVDMRVVTGTGNVVTDEVDPEAVLHPSIVGVNSAVVTGTYQVTVNYALESAKWVVNASAGVSWSVLILKQKAKQ